MSSPPVLLALLVLTLVSSSSTFIPALSEPVANVTHLPGFDGPLPFQLETGYEAVGDVDFFYYFIRSERKSEEDPILLWLSGGPGCSSLNGLFYEIGPLRFVHSEYDGSIPSLYYHPHSWTRAANIVFLDSPAGAGFSYLKSGNDYWVDDTISTRQICDFLVKWYYSHPQFGSNPLYIGGSSYAGTIVPVVAYTIVADEIAPLFSNLKGYVIGNPGTDASFDSKSRVSFAYGMGIIPEDLYKEIDVYCEGEEDYGHPSPENLPCNMALAVFDELGYEINFKYILDRKCFPPGQDPEVPNSNRRSLAGDKHEVLRLPTIAPDFKCTVEYAHYLSTFWTNDRRTREAFQVKKGTVEEWIRCNQSIPYTKDIKSALKYHHSLIQKGYRALVYSGDHDLMVPFLGTHAWIMSLNFSIVDDWRSWQVDGQVAGYTRRFMKDLTFATVKNAGHEATAYQPENCFAMFDRWISHERL